MKSKILILILAAIIQSSVVSQLLEIKIENTPKESLMLNPKSDNNNNKHLIKENQHQSRFLEDADSHNNGKLNTLIFT